MKARMFCVALLGLALAVPIAVGGGGDKAEFKAQCPLSGKPAKASSSVAFYGKRVSFCCDNCPKAFQAKMDKAKETEEFDEKLMAKVAHQLLGSGQIVQVGCPFSGKPVNEDTLVSFKGAKVGFCCNNCKGKFAKASDSEKLTMVFNKKSMGDCQAGTGSFVSQTRCPLSGKAITASQSIEHDGKKVFFCCAGCEKKFKSDPSKYTASLAAAKLTFKSGSCCDKASNSGKVCTHGCCSKAVAAGEACSKCNAI